MVIFEPVFRFLVNIGFLDVVLPFILVFSILHSVLEYTKVLGEEKKGKPKTKLNTMVAFAISLLVVGSIYLVGVISDIARYSALAIILGIFVYVFANLSGITQIKNAKVIAICSLIIIAIIALVSLKALDIVGSAILNSTIIPVFITFMLLFFIVWIIVREPKPERSADEEEKGPKKQKSEEKLRTESKVTPQKVESGRARIE